MKIVCIGGGAASFFFAANVSDMLKGADVTILEQGRSILNKVRISGGGRCNLTHHCFIPEDLVTHYPRGREELLGPFYHFGPSDTIDWFQQHGVDTKVESDGRMFPTSDSSETIIRCLSQACERNGVVVHKSTKVRNLTKLDENNGYRIDILNGDPVIADVVFMAPGSSNQMWQVLGHLGHCIVPPVPSLFTFQIRDARLAGLAGITVEEVDVHVSETALTSTGALLVTHKGLSGPSVLKLSAIGARELHSRDYVFEAVVDFCPQISPNDVRKWRDEHGKKLLGNHHVIGLPKRLTKSLLSHSGLDLQKKYASLSNKEMQRLSECLKEARFKVVGQNKFKEEFVTAGGVDLREVDMGSFGSKLHDDLYFAGEVLNIDGVTGGFNFQAAWTGAMIAARAVSSKGE